MLVLGKDLGFALCEVFGVEPSRVHRITLDAEADSAATVTIEHYIDDEQTGKLKKILSKYNLVLADV